MGNLALHSAEERDNLRATTGTVEVPTERDNDAATVLGARPIQQHEPAARHNGAQCGATANIDGAPVYALHMAESPDQQAESSLPRYDDSPSLFVPETPEGATRVTRQLFGAIGESTGMTPSSRTQFMQAGRWKRTQLSGRHPLFPSIRHRAQVRA